MRNRSNNNRETYYLLSFVSFITYWLIYCHTIAVTHYESLTVLNHCARYNKLQVTIATAFLLWAKILVTYNWWNWPYSGLATNKPFLTEWPWFQYDNPLLTTSLLYIVAFTSSDRCIRYQSTSLCVIAYTLQKGNGQQDDVPPKNLCVGLLVAHWQRGRRQRNNSSLEETVEKKKGCRSGWAGVKYTLLPLILFFVCLTASLSPFCCFKSIVGLRGI